MYVNSKHNSLLVPLVSSLVDASPLASGVADFSFPLALSFLGWKYIK